MWKRGHPKVLLSPRQMTLGKPKMTLTLAKGPFGEDFRDGESSEYFQILINAEY